MPAGGSYLLSALVCSMLLWAHPAMAQKAAEEASEESISGSLELVSDYRFRGVSLSSGGAALQLGAEYAHPSGIYAGAWGSTIADSSGAGVETDLYVGYSGEAAGLTYTVTAFKYLYPGAERMTYMEFQADVAATLGRANLTLEVAFTPNQKNMRESVYTAAAVSFEAPFGIRVSAKAGHENGAYKRKWDWELSMSRTIGPLALRAAYVATNKAADLGNEGKPTLLVAAALHFETHLRGKRGRRFSGLTEHSDALNRGNQ